MVQTCHKNTGLEVKIENKDHGAVQHQAPQFVENDFS